MPISREELIALLNQDLSLEYAAAIQYTQHASVIREAQLSGVVAHMQAHAREELGHAEKLSKRIDYMGGVPTTQVGPVKVSADPSIMVAQDLVGEATAVSRYKERVGQAMELQEHGLVALLQEILLEEEEHENDLQLTMGLGAPVQVTAPAAVQQRFAALRLERAKRMGA